jgi:hypothetical protein
MIMVMIMSDEMKDKAAAIYNKYVQVNSAEEVNVSFTVRGAVEKQLKIWTQGPVLTVAEAKSSLAADKYRFNFFTYAILAGLHYSCRE